MRYIFGDYVFDTQRQELHRAGVPLKLRRKVFQVLVYLLAHRERVVRKQELLEHLWPDQFVGDEALKSCIKTLRKALGDSGRTARCLRTVHGRGYRFVAAVEMREPLAVNDAPHDLSQREAEGATRQAEVPSPALAPPRADPDNTPWEALDGEHKQVTVLCGTLAEALTLAVRLGPEAMHHLMRDVLALAQGTVQRYEGTLLQVSGEGFLALFGAPVAQEDHARRAVLAALELRQRLHARDALRGQPPGVALRLGLHSGPVVIGPLANDAQRPYTAMGDTLSLATWLQQRAAPDTILVSAATYALVQGEVQGEACAPLAREAPSSSVSVYMIRDLTRRRAGVPRRGARPLSRFVGRTQELALLHARLAHAVGGQGQVLGIVGEPGLGKSRLLAEFAHSLDGQVVTYCEGHCLAYGSTTPYLPVRDLLRQLWDLPATAAPDALTATVEQRLREAGGASEAEALLVLQCLDVPVDLAPLAVLDPPQRKARTFALLRHVIRHASQQQPLVLAVENLHWSDPTSEEWLAALVEQLGDLPVLLLVTARPGYQPPWLGHAAATQIALPRLSRRESLTVLHSVPQAAQLPASLHQTIVTKAVGNPFFVEELTWAAVAHGDDAGPLPLPDTIEAVLAARIDRLPPEDKRLLQIAAVIGPEVPVALVQQLAGLPEDTLQRGLAHLQAAEFLYETRLFPEQAYTFKHALTHEVAYGSLLLERRRILHARIVESLEALAPEQVERLAHHALRGEVWEKALAYGHQAGDKARTRSAYREAVVCFEQALAALEHLPDRRAASEQAIDLRLGLRITLNVLGEAPERQLDHLRCAETLAQTLGDHLRLGWVYAEMNNQFWLMGDVDRAIDYGQRALALAATLGDVGLQAWAHLDLGRIYYDAGDYARAVESFEWNVVALHGELLYERAGTNGSIAASSRAWLSYCHAELGAFTEGLAMAEDGLRIAETDHPFRLIEACYGVSMVYLRQGELQRATPVLERGRSLCQDWHIPIFLPRQAAALGLAYVLEGRVAVGLALAEQGVEQEVAIGIPRSLVPVVTLLSEAYLLADRLEEARHRAEQALDLARQYQLRGHQAWALWLLSESTARHEPPEVEPAAGHYCQALALAEELGMRPLQAHCHRGLGTLYARTGQRQQARAALAAAIVLYCAMDMTFWLPQAEATLAHVWRT